MKCLFYIFIIFAISFNSGCQKNSIKKNSEPRCIYDQSVFTQCCLKAVADEQAFASFKRDPFYSLLYQGYSFEEGLSFLHAIENHSPSLITHFDVLRTNDEMGNPRIYDYGKYGLFSPTTLRHIQIAGRIRAHVGGAHHIIQIGGGYGGLCKILHALSLWESYTIVDLPEHLALARKVLEKEGIKNVRFLNLDAIPLDAEYDLVISDLSFSEFSRRFQKIFIDRILVHARSGYILGHVFPKHFGVEPFTPDELKEYLEKKKNHIEMQYSKTERADYHLFWKHPSQ